MCLQPNDKQDVPLAYLLLTEISKLKPPEPNTHALYAETRRALNILGKIFLVIIDPYTNRTMNLRDQLISLSTAAHCVLALYTKSRSSFMPVQLYGDIMHMIKNVFFCVTKIRIDDPTASFFIILLGTDRLEVIFGILRSMVGNDSNVDIYQLASRLVGAAEASSILSRHPEWDRGPNHLILPPLKQQENGIDARVDHLNVESWTGNTAVATVSPRTCWTLGRTAATEIMRMIWPSYHFNTLINLDGVDILCPFGQLIQASSLETSDEDNEEPVCSFLTLLLRELIIVLLDSGKYIS